MVPCGRSSGSTEGQDVRRSGLPGPLKLQGLSRWRKRGAGMVGVQGGEVATPSSVIIADKPFGVLGKTVMVS